MRNMDLRLRKLETATMHRSLAIIWWDQQSDAELKAEIAEREAKGFHVLVTSWNRSSCAGSTASDVGEPLPSTGINIEYLVETMMFDL
jgi:hypothetical protein